MSDILNFKKREEELQKIQEDIQANNISDNTKYEALNSEKTNAYNQLTGKINQQEQHFAQLKE